MKHDAAELRDKVIRSLQAQGFRVRDGMLLPPAELSKESIRKLHATAVEYQIELAKSRLSLVEQDLLRYIASGHEVDPLRMSPRLVEVLPGSEEALLFRYASLHWSIPVSAGYGRRLRFLVIDDDNGKLVGLIGLTDPVYGLRPRDEWIGWTHADREKRLRHVMDAFVLGAVPPYSFFLGGKLVAMLATSDTVRRAFAKKYDGTRSVIRREVHDGRLVLITTTSALGRSSIYNRLRFGDRLLYQSVGYTNGYGVFHFSNGLYEAIREFVKKHCKSARHGQWGSGFHNRLLTIRKCLSALGLSSDWISHGIKREIFVAPLAHNAREFLQGQHAEPLWYEQTEARLFEHFKHRWMLPRISRDDRFKSWSRGEWILWSKKENAQMSFPY